MVPAPATAWRHDAFLTARARLRVAGMPQTVAPSPSGGTTLLAYFKFVVSERRSVVISVTPVGGDADLYVGTSAAQMPTPFDSQWRSQRFGADAAYIDGSEAGALSNGTYWVCVQVYAGVSEYTIVAATVGSTLTLRQRVPVFTRMPSAGSTLFRVFASGSTNATLQVVPRSCSCPSASACGRTFRPIPSRFGSL